MNSLSWGDTGVKMYDVGGEVMGHVNVIKENACRVTTHLLYIIPEK